jgi:hypothetical protein
VFYDVAAGKERFRKEVQNRWQHRIHFLPDGKSYAAVDTRSSELVQMEIISVETGRSVRIFDLRFPEKTYVSGEEVLFSPDGGRLAVFSTPSEITVWDVRSGKKEAIVDCQRGRAKTFFAASPAFPKSLAFSPDGKLLAGAILGERVGQGKVKGMEGRLVMPGGVKGGLKGAGGLIGGGMPGGMRMDMDACLIELWNIDEVAKNPPPPAKPPSRPTDAKRPHSAMRMWTSADGKFTIEAELVGVQDGKATLRRRDGKEVVVAIERLGDADRQWIKEWFN